MDINFIIQLTINGILLGAFYAAMTMGFSIIWGVMRLINLAHGEFLLMGAYVAWFFFNPTSAQKLTLGGGDPEEVRATFQLVIIGGVIIISSVVGEFVLAPRYHSFNPWLRRGLTFAGFAVVGAVLYTVWQNRDFQAVDVTMMFMVLGGLALSIAFLINHFLLRTRLPNIWQRRAIGYPIGIAIMWVVHNRWEASGFRAIDPFLAIPLIMLLFFVMGYMLQKAIFNRLVNSPHLIMLLITFAVKIILQNLGMRIYLADPRRINIDYAGDFWTLAEGVTLGQVKFAILIICGLLLVVLTQFLQRSKVGQAIRAAAQNSMAARLMGININETYALTFGIALALTAAVGVMMGTFQPMTPFSGSPWTLRAFAIVALGGLGRVQGVVAGGLALGLAESYIGGSTLGSGWALAAAFMLLVVMLVIRPQGITGGLRPQEA